MRQLSLMMLTVLLMSASAPRAMAAWIVAREFHEPGTDHYVLATMTEASGLGESDAWDRTASAFRVSDGPAPGVQPVCRFAGTFLTANAHFYTADAEECESLKLDPRWTFEGVAFYAYAANVDGSCPIGTGPVYRLYNNSRFSVPGHRFTPLRSERARMTASGWLAEGAGPHGVAFCVPTTSLRVAFGRLQAFAAHTWGFVWSTEFFSTIALTLRFDPVTVTDDDGFPFRASSSFGDGFARYDPLLDRMVVVWEHEQFVFAYDGEHDVEGCVERLSFGGYVERSPLDPCLEVVGGRITPRQ